MRALNPFKIDSIICILLKKTRSGETLASALDDLTDLQRSQLLKEIEFISSYFQILTRLTLLKNILANWPNKEAHENDKNKN